MKWFSPKYKVHKELIPSTSDSYLYVLYRKRFGLWWVVEGTFTNKKDLTLAIKTKLTNPIIEGTLSQIYSFYQGAS